MYDLDKLTDKEVNELIAAIKESLNNLPGSFPLVGKVNGDYKITDKNNQIDYTLHVYRGKINTTRYSIHIRFNHNHQHLVRLCINAGNNHINKSDGSKVGRNHIHIYDVSEPGYNRAFELNNYMFSESDMLIEAFLKFVKFLNIGGEGI